MKTRILELKSCATGKITYLPQKKVFWFWMDFNRGRIFYTQKSCKQWLDNGSKNHEVIKIID